MNLKCAVCGTQADEGSMKHPYCKKHFESKWHGNYDEYFAWLRKSHK